MLEGAFRGANGLRRPHARRILLVALGTLLLGASPDGCNGWDNVGLVSSHLHPNSPDAQDSRFDDPVVVTRDSPWFVGAFFSDPGISGDPGSAAYSAHGRWSRCTTPERK